MKKLILSSAIIGFFSFSPAFAQEEMSGSSSPSYLSAGLGIWDITQDDDTATDFRIEYRDGNPWFWKISPWGGLEFTTDGSVWGGVGLLADFEVTQNIYITPSFGVGLYTEGSSDKDLDYPIEFRSQIEGGYEFDNQHRIGVAFGHISNADLGDDNPGTEILNVYYHVPVGDMF